MYSKRFRRPKSFVNRSTYVSWSRYRWYKISPPVSAICCCRRSASLVSAHCTKARIWHASREKKDARAAVVSSSKFFFFFFQWHTQLEANLPSMMHSASLQLCPCPKVSENFFLSFLMNAQNLMMEKWSPGCFSKAKQKEKKILLVFLFPTSVCRKEPKNAGPMGALDLLWSKAWFRDPNRRNALENSDTWPEIYMRFDD